MCAVIKDKNSFTPIQITTLAGRPVMTRTVIEPSKTNLKKYTYVLPSGRKLKVVLDESGDYTETACSVPCFLLRIDDEVVG